MKNQVVSMSRPIMKNKRVVQSKDKRLFALRSDLSKLLKETDQEVTEKYSYGRLSKKRHNNKKTK